MEKLKALRGASHLVMGDAIAMRSKKTTNQLRDLPGIQAGLKELVPQTDEIR